MVNPREQTPPGQSIQSRIRVTTRHKHPFLFHPIFIIPMHRHPVRRILTRDPHTTRHSLRANLFETNQANSCNRKSIHELRPEARWQHLARHLCINPVIQQNATPNDSLESWYFHNVGLDKKNPRKSIPRTLQLQ